MTCICGHPRGWHRVHELVRLVRHCHSWGCHCDRFVLSSPKPCSAQLRQCAVLVLDDPGTHKSADRAEERLFRLIDERYRDLRPLVVTTNVGLMERPDRVESRLSDGSCSTLVNFTGPDRRTPGDT